MRLKTTDLINSDNPVADLHSKILDSRPPLGPIFFIFMQFLENFGQIIGWRSLGLVPPSRKSWIRRCNPLSVAHQKCANQSYLYRRHTVFMKRIRCKSFSNWFERNHMNSLFRSMQCNKKINNYFLRLIFCKNLKYAYSN